MKVITPPASLPVTVENLAGQLHFDDAEIPALSALLTAATDVVETATRRPIVPRVVEIALPETSWSEFWLPVAPVIELLGATGVELKYGFDEPRILRGDFSDESIQVRVGYAESTTIHNQLKQAIILLVLEWREAQISVGEAYQAPSLSFGVQRLIKQVRYRRPQVVR